MSSKTSDRSDQAFAEMLIAELERENADLRANQIIGTVTGADENELRSRLGEVLRYSTEEGYFPVVRLSAAHDTLIWAMGQIRELRAKLAEVAK